MLEKRVETLKALWDKGLIEKEDYLAGGDSPTRHSLLVSFRSDSTLKRGAPSTEARRATYTALSWCKLKNLKGELIRKQPIFK